MPGPKSRYAILFAKLILLFCFCPIISLKCFAADDQTIKNDTAFSYYQIIAQRNFFRPDKKLGTSETYQRPGIKNDDPDFILTGVIEIKNGYKAILEQISSKKGFYISVDETIGDFKVKEISSNQIVLSRDGRDFSLKLQQVNQEEQ